MCLQSSVTDPHKVGFLDCPLDLEWGSGGDQFANLKGLAKGLPVVKVVVSLEVSLGQ